MTRDLAPMDGVDALQRLIGLTEYAEAVRATPGPITDCVYYWLRDDLIKIGHTRCLRKRIAALRPGGLLAVEPGAYNIEQGRHRQFADYHAPDGPGTEWFRPGPLLVWHVEAMARLYPIELLNELPQMHVSQKQLGRSATPRYGEMGARERLAKWVEMLPQIAAEIPKPRDGAA